MPGFKVYAVSIEPLLLFEQRRWAIQSSIILPRISLFTTLLPQFIGANWLMYAMVSGTLAIIYLFPFITKAVPSAFVVIIFMTIVSFTLHLDLKTVGDMGQITQSLPKFHLPAVPFSLDTLLIVFPTSLAIVIVGLTESLVTATIIDEMTGTSSNKNREARGQGIANIVSGLFGGMAGCGMIGQSVINVQSGGGKRLSTLAAGVFLSVLIMLLGDVVKQVLMAALVGVMVTVSIGTFDWHSVRHIHKYPLSEAVIMILTVYTKNLAIGVVLGVALSALVFGWKIAHIKSSSKIEGNKNIYTISGQMFFGTTNYFLTVFDYEHDPDQIEIDFTHSHIWDHSRVTAIGKVIEKYESHHKKVTLVGLNEEIHRMIDRIGLQSVSSYE
ncbi:SulP family inorganic anion transporter [Heyndrickxia ginsengihumi]|uniref:SulP family inorganic anion transporter n=1 Tax=Heyndrickxia ginsengihumi TaxID=363870 RepID=UPI00203A8784|nr:SulP family inorganic anion transporter [Heyndrickxia ginsengihumi]MCM3024537.1 SulP family inorganic anion transporter [Heyndrickxia ginsengihumi]